MNKSSSTQIGQDRGRISQSANSTFSPRVPYKDQRRAVEWLEKAFGFKTRVFATDKEEHVIYAEMRYGNGRIHIGSEWDSIKSPNSVGGANTQTIAVQLESGI